jgi:hypothetical protein
MSVVKSRRESLINSLEDNSIAIFILLKVPLKVGMNVILSLQIEIIFILPILQSNILS